MQCAGVFDYRNAVTHIAWMRVPVILEKIVEATGWDQTELANKLGTSQPTVSRWMDKERPQEPRGGNERRIMRLAQKLEIIKDTSGNTLLTVPILGYVGAGGTVDYSNSQGPFGEAKMPPEGKATTVAVVVRGDSMAGVLEDGSVVYYDNRHEPPTDALFKKLCVVGLTDGRVLIKRLLPGSQPGLFHLFSVSAPPLLDQSVEWAAKVSFIAPE